ncbi:3-hydroxyacyl-CoA dehydrogenase NAD-binding domain-containing protein [Streptomyces sp. NPDC057199]|uniref:3-hydroxyacyl-CoA dehydrogenase NAD-binding domain-containing protein n=1 Tax=Streptomyces sp. NPDC057199 TaxID=3346047 RepID=UPI00363630E4
MQTIRWDQDADGVVTLTLDDPSQTANTVNAAYRESMDAVLERLAAEREAVKGIVLTSAKKTFLAGVDLNDVRSVGPDQAAELAAFADAVKAQLRTLETLGIPVAAVINGTALGGGLEIALACHHRVALDAPGIRIGLPEVTLGLLPGGGGVIRTVRLLGLEKALSQVLLRGQRLTARQAYDTGLISELADSPDEALTKAKAWVLAHPQAVQPWDETGYRIPGGTPADAGLAATLPTLPARLRHQSKGAPMPAPRNILCAAVEGTQVDFATASAIETRYFVELAIGPIAKNMMQAFFFDQQVIKSGAGRPAGYDTYEAKAVAVLGAGMMGAGIAYSCALAGMKVLLKDVSVEAAECGKGYAVKLVDKGVAKGAISRDAGNELLARIVPVAEAAEFAAADLVIEAVFEDPELKKQVFADAEPHVAADALLASNTSTLPITELAEGISRPDDFIGLHFFSPVDKMALVEVIVGERTSDAALAKAVDVVRQLCKTPIVVNDSRGFFTSRVIQQRLLEAAAMLAEGVAAQSIEQASTQAGYPLGTLALFDEVTLTLPRQIRGRHREAVEARGERWQPHPGDAVLARLMDEFHRAGRSTGAGFHDYADGRRAGLWPGLAEHFPATPGAVPFQDLKDRLLFCEALESVRCLDEKVLRSTADANVGSILGIGYPCWSGGVIQFVNGYPGGIGAFVARARELADRYGDRFAPPASLVALAETGVLVG